MKKLLLLVVLAAFGCGEATKPFGVGGGSGFETGGVPSTGGAVGTGGAGGVSSTGGALATGGVLGTGGAAATGGAPATGGAAGAAPSNVTRIWPVGDSLTAGGVEDANFNGDCSGGGWRAPLFASLVRRGMNIDFVGSYSNAGAPCPLAPGVMAGSGHDGHPGISASAVRGSDLLAAWLPSPAPHIVLLSLGTNDADTVASGQNIGWLIDRLRVLVPMATIFVATDPPASRSPDREVINAQIAREVAARPGVRLVDMFQAGLVLDEPTVPHGDYSGPVGDNLHPSLQGYGKMAVQWEKTLVAVPQPDPACAGKAEGTECRAPACGGPTAQIGGPTGGVYQTQAIYYECRASKCTSVTRDCTGTLTCANGTTQACGARGFCYNPADRNTCACYDGPDQVPVCR